MVIRNDVTKVICLIGLIAVVLLYVVGQTRELNAKGESIELQKQEIHQLENDIDFLKKEINEQKDQYEKLKQTKAKEKLKTKTASANVTYQIKNTGSTCYTAMKKYFPAGQWENASLVISRESGGNPKAVSSTDDHGCFQIHNGDSHGAVIYNPDFNAKLAYNRYYATRGWTPWYAVRGILW